MMKKKLVYFLYIADTTPAKKAIENSKLLRLHFELLKRFHNVFDEAVFVLSLNKGIKDGKDDVIRSWAAALMEIGYLNVRFTIEENTSFRECKAFKEEVVEKEDNKGKLVFFGHNKGTTNQYNERLVRLICSMYYFSLNFIEDLDVYMINHESVYYGFPLLNAQWNTPNGWEMMPKYKYYFYGTFFWTNVSLLWEVMDNKKREYPELVSRFYAENFPANTIEFDAVATHRNVYMLSGKNLHYEFDVSFDEYCRYKEGGEEVKKNFNEFVENVKMAAKI